MDIRHWCVMLAAAGLVMLAMTGCPPRTARNTPPNQRVAGTQERSTTVAVSLTDFAISMNPTSAPAGIVIFNVSNDGRAPHAFEIEGQGVDEETRTLDAGEKQTLRIENLRPGSYRVYCPVGNHEERGMRGTFTVTAATSQQHAAHRPPTPAAGSTGGAPMTIQVTSTAFREGEMIPVQYTCDGTNQSPPLAWTGVPDHTRAQALTCVDPDAPSGNFIHWVIYNMPAERRSLPTAVPTMAQLAGGGVQGTNSARTVGYTGPCPPSGTHRYYFTVYALDAPLSLPGSAVTQTELIKAMEGHILAQGQLMGRYQRQR